MGGSVLMGIRRRNGSEHLWQIWTNIVPHLFATPNFIKDGKGVDKFIREHEALRSRKGNLWCAQKLSAVEYSEYGVILIDFVSKRILSRQDYCRPGVVSIFWHDGQDMYGGGAAKMVLDLFNGGRLEKIVDISTHHRKDRKFSPQRITKFLRLCREAGAGNMPQGSDYFVEIHTRLNDFTVDHNNTRPRRSAKTRLEIKEFLENGWRARIRGTR